MRTFAFILIVGLVAFAASTSQALGGCCHHGAGNDEFLEFLARIDNGKGPGPTPKPPADSGPAAKDATTKAWSRLFIELDLQRKDTGMLCLDGCSETGDVCWDGEQEDHNGHGSSNCGRAVAKMANSFYGSSLSQDRITYWMIAQYPDSNKKALDPDFSLWHGRGSGPEFIPWSLGFAYNDWSPFTRASTKPTYNQIKAWINARRPVSVAIPGHALLIDGWWDDNGVSRVYVLDPWCVWDGNESHPGTGWRLYTDPYLDIREYTIYPTQADVPSPRSDETTVHTDSDGDGIVDFDELYRFFTNRYSSDTDGDGVHDKQEIRSYIFDHAGNHNVLERIGNIWICKVQVTAEPCGYVYNPEATGVPWANLPAGWTCPRCGNAKSGFRNEVSPCMPLPPYDPNPDVMGLIWANADPDGDGLRNERDPDSDNDGALDGQEDTNHNGKYEPDLGETDPYDPDSRPYDTAGVIWAKNDLMAADDAVAHGRLLIHGDLRCTGNKAVIPTTDYGSRLVFVDESAGSYHFDRGRSQLADGAVTIHLDPVFLQTVSIGQRHPPVIRLMPTADCRGLYVARWTPTSFTVREAGGGASGATFNWEIAAKRKGYEAERLGPIGPPD